jgi:hypothetical protein
MKTPVINVNLAQCDKACEQHDPALLPDGGHWTGCAAKPILIPCPIRRSVTFHVALGECRPPKCHQSLAVAGAYGITKPSGIHSTECPARPIRVACSVSGKTWAESEVKDVETRDETWHPSAPRSYRALSACRARWALVKALVLGEALSPTYTLSADARKVVEQRDAVFSALADMALAEMSMETAIEAMNSTMYAGPRGTRWAPIYEVPESKAQDALERYVEHLIEQVSLEGT